MVFMFLSVQYAIIMIMLFAVFLKYEVSEFSQVLLSAVFTCITPVKLNGIGGICSKRCSTYVPEGVIGTLRMEIIVRQPAYKMYRIIDHCI